MSISPAADLDLNISAPDTSSRAGIFLGAMAIGSSFQPNLLTRGTRDQAIISGLSAAVAYGVASAGNSVLGSMNRRIPGSETVGEVLLSIAGAAVVKAIPNREHESHRRSAIRLAGLGTCALGLSSLAARANTATTSRISGNKRFVFTAALTGATAGATYLFLRKPGQTVGAQLEDGSLFEDSNREVNPQQAIGISIGIASALLGVAHGESYLAKQSSRFAARLVGGLPEDHVTAGRVTTFAVSAVAGRLLLSKLMATLNKAGEGEEVAHSVAPTIPEVTGSPESGIPWSAQSREGRRWLSMVLEPGAIEQVMDEPAKQPIRVYASLQAADTDEARVDLLMAELERTHAFDREVIALFSPTGSGYVNYVACETFEYLTRGNCASMCIEYSVLPSAFSLQLVPLGIRQTRLVVDRIVARLLATEQGKRPRFVLFGESLGSQVSQGMFTDQGVDGLRAVGLDAAVWVGTPSASDWRKQLWGKRSLRDAPDVGPKDAYLPRSIQDWHRLDPAQREGVRYLLLQNGDDPIPKFGSSLMWRQPAWLGPAEQRPIGTPKGTTWIPFVTFVQTFIDMLNALTPTPGVFAEGGHDYRVEIPGAVQSVFRLPATSDQMNSVQQALRVRELQWEAARKWEDAEANTDSKKREEAEAKVENEVGTWLGRSDDAPVTEAELHDIIDKGEVPEVLGGDGEVTDGLGPEASTEK
ncbi:MAG: alpha/beta-hydrolase family protein [Actinobacteria bacterium]|nr:alpha/beta-hydrolase family protein [Actinomycetota bacterium]